MQRIANLKEGRTNGDRIVYWMQASQRTRWNLALEHAIRLANEHSKPLDVLFVINPRYPGANRRSFTFMFQGLDDVHRDLMRRGVNMSVRIGDTVTEVLDHIDGAAALVMDKGYLRHQNEWYGSIAEATDIAIIQAEDNVVVPVRTVSSKEEWSAATLRRRIAPLLNEAVHVVEENDLSESTYGEWGDDLAWLGAEEQIRSMKLTGLPPSVFYRGGQDEAERLFSTFLDEGLRRYGEMRNEPSEMGTSGMSPYLHFGQVSPLMLAYRAMGREGSAPFIEELVVRRELAVNFVNYNDDYDSYACLPDWARRTLDDHRSDRREYVYSLKELENAETHDVYWNSAQSEMVATGKMHGYMRMYWGKKIIEWSEDPETAYENALRLNDEYELDGRDPNGYAGVAWCFGKHDRPWKERDVFGMVRYMNARGLERKFFMPGYVDRVLSVLSSLQTS